MKDQQVHYDLTANLDLEPLFCGPNKIGEVSIFKISASIGAVEYWI